MSLLSDAEKVDIRRFCGYPAYGAAPAGMQSWRFFQSYGLLEFHINNLSISEIAITRRYLGSLTSLELAIPATSENLDTDQASMWTRNKDELRDRMRLFNLVRDLTADSYGGWENVTTIQAGGGLAAQRIVALRSYDLEAAKQRARTAAGIGQPVAAH